MTSWTRSWMIELCWTTECGLKVESKNGFLTWPEVFIYSNFGVTITDLVGLSNWTTWTRSWAIELEAWFPTATWTSTTGLVKFIVWVSCLPSDLIEVTSTAVTGLSNWISLTRSWAIDPADFSVFPVTVTWKLEWVFIVYLLEA